MPDSRQGERRLDAADSCGNDSDLGTRIAARLYGFRHRSGPNCRNVCCCANDRLSRGDEAVYAPKRVAEKVPITRVLTYLICLVALTMAVPSIAIAQSNTAFDGTYAGVSNTKLAAFPAATRLIPRHDRGRSAMALPNIEAARSTSLRVMSPPKAISKCGIRSPTSSKAKSTPAAKPPEVPVLALAVALLLSSGSDNSLKFLTMAPGGDSAPYGAAQARSLSCRDTRCENESELATTYRGEVVWFDTRGRHCRPDLRPMESDMPKVWLPFLCMLRLSLSLSLGACCDPETDRRLQMFLDDE